MTKPNGYLIYEGPSVLDGEQIAVIAVMQSANVKTGNVVQTFIIRADVGPVEAVKSGADSSICGDCKHRPILGGACYVNVGQAPASVFRSYKAGKYARDIEAAAEACAGRIVRLGAYGDPMAVPAEIWQKLLEKAAGRLGYSHQWQKSSISEEQRAAVMQYCMASVDNAAEMQDAKEAGFRWFRVRTSDEPLEKREFICPSSDEGGNRMQCDRCKACSGSEKAAAASVAIVVHGSKAWRFIAIKKAEQLQAA